MVNTTCAVHKCLSSSRNKNLKFHQFPRTEERCKAWIEACNRPDLLNCSIEELKNTYVCSLHFDKRMYGKTYLKKFAFPALHLNRKDTQSTETQTDNQIIENKTIYIYKIHGKQLDDCNKASEDVDYSASYKQYVHEHNEIDKVSSTPSKHECHIKKEMTENTAEHETIQNNNEHIKQEIDIKMENIYENHMTIDDTIIQQVDQLNGHKRKQELTLEDFLNACDTFLSPELSDYVKKKAIEKAVKKEDSN